jgi:hypothetical protein
MGAMWWSSKRLIVVTDRHQYEIQWTKGKSCEYIDVSHYCEGCHANGVYRPSDLRSADARKMNTSDLTAWALRLCPDGFPLGTFKGAA